MKELVDLVNNRIEELGLTKREVSEVLDRSRGNFSRDISMGGKMQLEYVVKICEAIDLDPSVFIEVYKITIKKGKKK